MIFKSVDRGNQDLLGTGILGFALHQEERENYQIEDPEEYQIRRKTSIYEIWIDLFSLWSFGKLIGSLIGGDMVDQSFIMRSQRSFFP